MLSKKQVEVLASDPLNAIVLVTATIMEVWK